MSQSPNTGTGGPQRPPVLAIGLVALIGLPIIWLSIAAFSATGSGGLAASILPRSLLDTGLLMASVGVVTAVLGLVSAWLVSHFEFPGRRMLEWALILPLAVPTYLAAFSYAEFLGFTGPIQQAVRALTGAQTLRDYWFPDIRTPGGGVIVLSAVLYPYVYASCRAFFLMQSGTVGMAARVLGANGVRNFFAVTLPLSRPAIVVGATLAMMEVVNDLGAVQYFGINSLTAIIYSTWINRSNFGGAAQLAVTIVLVIALLILAEQWARRDRIYLLARDSRTPHARDRLPGMRGLLASGFCLLLVLSGFGVPFGQMVWLAFRNIRPQSFELALSAGSNTLMLAAAGAVITVAIGLLAARQSAGATPPVAKGAIRIATLGYAIPGTVLALGLLQPLGQADLWFNRTTMALFDWRPGLVLSGSIAALLYVYAIRFLAVGHTTLDAAIRKRGESMLDGARVLGASGLRLFLRIDLPTLSPALLTAATLVFVEIAKELPATLLLRPLGVETLATVVYGRAQASLFTEAALPALAIVLVGLVPVLLSTRIDRRR